MMFHRYVGAVRDYKELEYLVALLQATDDGEESFLDGSIDAQDVKVYLMSRYGIKVSREQVREFIFKGLAGGEEEDESLDILEVVAILVIPMLVKLQHEHELGGRRESKLTEEQRRLLPPVTIIEDVLKNILFDTTEGTRSLSEPPALTPAFLKAMFLQFDEVELARDDQLIADMIEAAKPENESGDESGEGDQPLVLDADTFARALSKDIMLYNPDVELRQTTCLEDVFPQGLDREPRERHTSSPKMEEVKDTEVEKLVDFEKGLDGEDDGSEPKKAVLPPKLRTKNTLSQIDYTADTVRFSLHVTMMWLIVVFTYFFYMTENHNQTACDQQNFGCSILNSSFTWLQIMSKLIIFVGAIGCSLSYGNDANGKSSLGPIIGLISVIIFVFVPPFYPDPDPKDGPDNVKYYLFNTHMKDDTFQRDNLWPVLLVFGLVMAIIQIRTLLQLYYRKKPGKMEKLKANKFLQFFDKMLGSNRNREYQSKQASIFKVNEMVRNAYKLHKLDMEETQKQLLKTAVSEDTLGVPKQERESSKELALQKYSDLLDETETCGGFIWGWKEFLSGRLAMTEGVWLPSRLLAGNVIQFVMVIIVLTISIITFDEKIEEIMLATTFNRNFEDCNSTFEATKCYFPFENLQEDGFEEIGEDDKQFYTGVGVCRDVHFSAGCKDKFFGEPIDKKTMWYSNTCELMDTSFEKVGNAYNTEGCTKILKKVEEGVIKKVQGWMKSGKNKGFSKQVVTDVMEDQVVDGFGLCWRFKNYKLEQIAEFNKETGENITKSDVEFCGNFTNLITEKFLHEDAGIKDIDVEGFEDCMNAYGGLRPVSMCEREFYRVGGEVATYEDDKEPKAFCRSFLSYCSLDPINPLMATCVIGEKDMKPFQFEGKTCRDYYSISKMMNFFDRKILPQNKKMESLKPEKWQLLVTAYFGILCGTVAAFATALVYIPSSIHTILKFRSGVIESLRDPTWHKYTKELHNQSYLIGSMFWGLVVAVMFVTALASAAIFFCLWEGSREIFFNLVTMGIGITITVVLKMIICAIVMKKSYLGFYRKKPGLANGFNFGLECWNLALTLAFVISRFGKFLFCTGIYIGRMDRPVLAKGLLIDCDKLPLYFYQNLLSAEAHRHPYIGLLGYIYLMKLRHQDKFGNKPGATWRLLFVVSLMPWLRKKRIKEDELGDLWDEVEEKDK